MLKWVLDTGPKTVEHLGVRLVNQSDDFIRRGEVVVPLIGRVEMQERKDMMDVNQTLVRVVERPVVIADGGKAQGLEDITKVGNIAVGDEYVQPGTIELLAYKPLMRAIVHRDPMVHFRLSQSAECQSFLFRIQICCRHKIP